MDVVTNTEDPELDPNWEIAKFRMQMAGMHAMGDGYTNLAQGIQAFLTNGENMPHIREYIIEMVGANYDD